MKNKWKGPPHEDIPRCGARTRSGSACGHYSMANGRCRYHGGKSTGAINPHRPLKNGNYTKRAMEERMKLSQFLKECMKYVNRLE